MSSARLRENVISGSPSRTLPALPFPTDQSLFITTCNSVSKWTTPQDIQKIYRSAHDCIVSAKCTEDDVLAVADGRTVLLDKDGAIQRRYKLEDGSARLCVLAYSRVSQELLFSTTLEDAILRYSVVQDRVLDWKCYHPSPPTILAISALSQYAISASQAPTIVCLSLLEERRHILVHPSASNAAVTAAAFHGKTEEHFLLAFADGTVSVHTASRIVLMQTAGSDGSLGHLKRAHRTTNERYRRHVRSRKSNSSTSSRVGPRSVGITAAAFINGCKLRIVTVGGDGRCRLIDFARGAQVLRTWSINAPCTSLAVYSPSNPDAQADDALPRHIIAIGRTDGCVCLYDYLGLLREEVLVDSARRKIINLEWMPNPGIISRGKQGTGSSASDPSQATAGVEWKFVSPEVLPAKRQSPPPPSTKEQLQGQPRVIGRPKTPTDGESLSPWPKSPSSSSSKHSPRGASPQRPASDTTTSPPPRLIDSVIRSPLQSRTAQFRKVFTGSNLDGSKAYEVGSSHSNAPLPAEQPFDAKAVASRVVFEQEQVSNDTSQSMSSELPGSWVSEDDLTVPANELRPSAAAHQPYTKSSSSRSSPSRSVVHTPMGSEERRRLLSETLSTEQRVSSPLSLADFGAAWDTDVESSPSRDHTYGDARGLRRMTLHDNIAVTNIANASFINMASSDHRLWEEEAVSRQPEPFPEYVEPMSAHTGGSPTKRHPLLPTEKPLPRLPNVSSSGCDCDCTNVIREEMALVRAEVASLRKALWVFGGRVESGRLSAMPDVAGDDEKSFEGLSRRWGDRNVHEEGEGEQRGRPRRRSSF